MQVIAAGQAGRVAAADLLAPRDGVADFTSNDIKWP
jgi:hypothetical protein